MKRWHEYWKVKYIQLVSVVIFFNHRNLKTFSRTDLYFFLQSTYLSMKNDVGKYEHLHHIVYVCGYFYVGVCKQSYIFQNDFINTTFFMIVMIASRGFKHQTIKFLLFVMLVYLSILGEIVLFSNFFLSSLCLFWFISTFLDLILAQGI